MRPLRYSINVTLDGCCDHRVMIADEDLHRHAAENLAQADALDGLLSRLRQPLDVVVKFEVPSDAIIGRVEQRFKAEGRADDNPDTVRKRLEVYAEQTAPVANFYAQRHLLKVVDGVGPIDEVTDRITGVLPRGTAPAGG